MMRFQICVLVTLAGLSSTFAFADGCQQQSAETTTDVATVTQSIKSGPIVIAHRGASGYLPEHTTEAATMAHTMGADFIEQDVVLSKDGIPVVLHDVTLNSVTNVADVFPDRKTDGKFYVYDFTLAELQQLKVTERRTDEVRFPRGQGSFQIGTLAEHLQLIQGLNRSRDKDIGVYVELKQPALHKKRGLDLAVVVLKTLGEFGYSKANDNIFIQCFEEDETKRLRTELKCRLRLIQLYSKRPTKERLAQIARFADGIGINIEALMDPTPEGDVQPNNVVKQAHEVALQVHAWTFRTDQLPIWAATSDDLLDQLFNEAHVDGVFADQPDVVINYLKKTEARQVTRGPFHLLHNDRK